MDEIRYWIETEGTGHWFFVAYPVILICLFIWFKGRRVRFLIPSLIISLVIINPIFYRKWEELGLYAYWRILWLVPVIPVVAGLIPSITERIGKTWIKAVVAAAGVCFIIFGGTFLYSGTGGIFVEAANAAKLPDYVVAIADRLLELDEHPRVIAQDPIGVYIRQYTGEIDTLYGRDIYQFILYPTDEVRTIHEQLSIGNVQPVAQFMIDNDYGYLVSNGIIEGNYELVDRVGDYSIYKALGTPSIIKEKNAIGQIVRVSNVDNTGNLVNNPSGYATVVYEYDTNGYVKSESYYNELAEPVYTSYGYATIRKKLDKDGQVVEEYYYDINGSPMKQQAGHVAIRQEWNDGRLLVRTYLDETGNEINRNDGYSQVMWKNSENGIAIELYDVNRQIVSLDRINLVRDIETFPDGWSQWFTPEPNTENCCFNIGRVNLDEKKEGDKYTCRVVVEFKNVKEIEGKDFWIATQGTADGGWAKGNIWNSKLMRFSSAPQDGVYIFENTCTIDSDTVDVNTFRLGFRCDNWESGMFRIRDVVIEKGEQIIEWSPGL